MGECERGRAAAKHGPPAVAPGFLRVEPSKESAILVQYRVEGHAGFFHVGFGKGTSYGRPKLGLVGFVDKILRLQKLRGAGIGPARVRGYYCAQQRERR